MSKINLSGNVSGIGVFTVAAPNSNVDRTIALPDQTGTMLSIAADGSVNNTSGLVNLGGGQVIKTAAGNLLVGTTSDQARLTISGRILAGVVGNSDNSHALSIAPTVAGNSVFNIAGIGNSLTFRAGNNADQNLNSELFRFTGGGDFLVGTTSTNLTNGGFYSVPGVNSEIGVGHAAASPSGSTFASFRYTNTQIGSITQNGTTAVLYNTTSDYRLKTFIAKVTDAGSRIDALNPIEYEWKSDGTRTRGFFAHEFQEIYADSVSGVKDAVDEEGKPVYQSMQASSSEVIADLVAEIQSLRKRLAALESKQ